MNYARTLIVIATLAFIVILTSNIFSKVENDTIQYKGFIHIEAEDAVETNFDRRPTTYFFASNRHTLQLNSTLPRDGKEFFAEYVFYNTIDREYDIWICGTPPGGNTNKYISPFEISFDKGSKYSISSDTSLYSHSYAPAGFYVYKVLTGRLSAGKHTLRITVSKPRAYDSKCVLYLDSIILIPVQSYSFVSLQDIPSIFPKNFNPKGKFQFPDISTKVYPKTVEQMLDTATSYIWVSQFENAQAQYKTILNRNPNNFEAILGYILTYLWMGKNQDSYNYCNSVIEKGNLPKNLQIELKKFLAQQYNWAGMYLEAENLYQSIIKEAPGDIEAIIGLANTYNWSNKVEKAIGVYEDALSRLGDNINLLTQLAENYEKNKQLTKAIYIYNKILEKQPDNFAIYQKLASLYTRTGQKEKAQEILSMRAQRKVVNIVQQGTLMEQTQPQKDEVIQAYLDSLRDDYCNITKHLNLLSVYEWYGKESESLQEYYTIFAIKLYGELQKNIKKYYKTLSATSKLFYLHNNYKNIETIQEETLEALQLEIENTASTIEKSILEKKLSGWEPNMPRLLGWIDNGTRGNAQFKTAMNAYIDYCYRTSSASAYAKSLQATPYDDYLPLLLLQAGDTATLTVISENAQKNKDINNFLDFLQQHPIVKKPKKTKKIIIPDKALLRAKNLRMHILEESLYNCLRDNFEFLKRMASYYIHLKDPLGAQESYDELYKIRSNDIDINLALADLYRWGKKYQSAIRQYEKVLDLDPDNQRAQKSRGELLLLYSPFMYADYTTHSEPIVTRHNAKLGYTYIVNDYINLGAYYGFVYIKDSLGFLLTPSVYSRGKSKCNYHQIGTNIEYTNFKLNTTFMLGYYGRRYNATIDLEYLKEYSTTFTREYSHNYTASFRYTPLTIPFSFLFQYYYEDLDELVQAIRLGLFQHRLQSVFTLDFSFIPIFIFENLSYTTSVDYRIISDENYRLTLNNKLTLKVYKNPFKGRELRIGGIYNYDTSRFNQYSPDNEVYTTQANLPYYAPIKLHIYGALMEWQHTIQLQQFNQIGYMLGLQYSRTTRGDAIYNPYCLVYGSIDSIQYRIQGSYIYSKSFETIQSGNQFRSYDISLSIVKKFFTNYVKKQTN
ncbi:MAG: tetratricopeptide repeat protein [Spirochaetota bacterium]